MICCDQILVESIRRFFLSKVYNFDGLDQLDIFEIH